MMADACWPLSCPALDCAFCISTAKSKCFSGFSHYNTSWGQECCAMELNVSSRTTSLQKTNKLCSIDILENNLRTKLFFTLESGSRRNTDGVKARTAEKQRQLGQNRYTEAPEGEG